MWKQKGFALIEILVILAVLIITAGGVVVWKKKTSPMPTPQVSPTPTFIPTFVPEITLLPKPTVTSKNGCIVSGCNGELCIDEESERVDTICRWLPQYECFRTATCERQTDGSCAFTQTPELKDCLNKFKIGPSFTPVPEKDCVLNGESSTNFDMTTSKSISGGKPCCEGLKVIGPKTPLESLNKGLCMEVAGSAGICRPCGNGICDVEYEDSCNCPEDCE